MKKLSTLFLTCIVLASATGTTISLHYCGKSLEDVAVFGKAKPCCGGMEMPSGCCHDEKFEIKSSNYQEARQIINAGYIPVLLAEILYPILDFSSHFQDAQSHVLISRDNSDPPANPDIIILVHSFLI